MQSGRVAASIGARATVEVTYEVCGSPGEVANEPSLGNRYGIHLTADIPDTSSPPLHASHSWDEGKQAVQYNVALTAPDQLRQRVAFALGSIFVISQVCSRLRERSRHGWPTTHLPIQMRLKLNLSLTCPCAFADEPRDEVRA